MDYAVADSPLLAILGLVGVVGLLLVLIARYVFADSLPAALRSVLGFVGWPVTALSLGVVLAYRNLKTAEARSKARSKWVETGLRTSAMILAVTGLGGSLSAILRGTPAVDFIAEGFDDLGLPAILLPFSIGVIGNRITGSMTVGVITAGALVAPMLPSDGLSPEAAMLAGASGSVIIKYVNSSYFWVCTTLSGLEPRDAIFSYGGATLVGGLVSFAVVWTLWGGGHSLTRLEEASEAGLRGQNSTSGIASRGMMAPGCMTTSPATV